MNRYGNADVNCGGFSWLKIVRDDRGDILRLEYNNLKENAPVNYAICKLEYDDDGNYTGCSYYDEHKKPVLCEAGFASNIKECNCQGKVVRDTYLGLEGQLVKTDLGYASRSCVYDDLGYLIEEYYYGTNGELLRSYDHEAYCVIERNDCGYRTQVTCYDPQGQPFAGGDYGVVRLYIKYNSRGFMVSIAGMNEVNAPMETNEGWATVKVEYDDRGTWAKIRYYDKRGDEIWVETASQDAGGSEIIM